MRMSGPPPDERRGSASHVHDTTRPAESAIPTSKVGSLEPNLLLEVNPAVRVNTLHGSLELGPSGLATRRGQQQLDAATGHLRRRAAESPRAPRNSLEVVLGPAGEGSNDKLEDGHPYGLSSAVLGPSYRTVVRKANHLTSAVVLIVVWRTGWDLNPRGPCGPTAFPVPRPRPS